MGNGGFQLGGGGVCRRFCPVIFLYGYSFHGDQFAQAPLIRQGEFVLGSGRFHCLPGGSGGKFQVCRIKPHQSLSAFDVVSVFHQFLDYFAGYAKTEDRFPYARESPRYIQRHCLEWTSP